MIRIKGGRKLKSINKDTYVEEAVAIIQNSEVMFLMKDDIVNIKTDGTEFKKNYKKVSIDPTPDEIWVINEEHNINIPFEYIEEIEFVSRNLV